MNSIKNNNQNENTDENENNERKILVQKNGLIMKRESKNNYELNFSIKNENIVLSFLFDFSILNLIFDLNKDIFEDKKLFILDDNTAKLYILIKPLLADFGMPQKYIYLNIHKSVSQESIYFIALPSERTIREDYENIIIPEDAEQLPLESLKLICNIRSQHEVEFIEKITYKSYINIPVFVEKMLGVIVSKMFYRIKQFIENYTNISK